MALDREDLQALREIMREEVAASEERMRKHIEEKNDELRRDLFVYIENHTEPKLDAIKEGLDAVLDHDYVKHEELEPIKEKIIVLEDVVKNHSAEIAELKRAK